MRPFRAQSFALAFLAAGCAEIAGIEEWTAGAAPPGGAGVGAAAGAGVTSSTASSTSSGTGGGQAGGCGPASRACCGVDCQGGDCQGGECQPVLLAEGKDVMRHLVVDATDVYFTEGGSIMRLPTNATGKTTATVFADVKNADFLAIDDAHVYWTVFASPGGSVNRQAKTDTLVVELAAAEPFPIGLSLLGSEVYWVRYEAAALYVTPRIGGPVASLGTTGAHPFMTANDGELLFWTFRGIPSDAAVPAGGVQKLAGTPADVAAGQPSPTGLAVDKTSVYWFGDDASLSRTPKDGGAVETMGAAEGSPGDVFGGEVVVDDTHAYWTGMNTCTPIPCPKILRVATKGGEPEVFAQGAWSAINGIALGPGALYWTTDDKRLFRKVTAR